MKYTDWYEITTKTIFNYYKNDSYLFMSLLAATSPRRSVKQNLKTTQLLFYDFDKKDLINYMQSNKIEFKQKYKVMDCHYYNILKSFQGLELSGLKVNSFYQNLIGNLEPVTIDVWILKYFQFTGNLNKTNYIKLSNRIKKQAKKQNLKPAQLQAQIWIETRSKYGFKPVTYLQYLDFNQLNLFN